jgi:hypothetical protein
MNPFPAIGRFFKRAFNWVIKNKDLQSFIDKFFQSVVIATVQELESSGDRFQNSDPLDGKTGRTLRTLRRKRLKP